LSFHGERTLGISASRRYSAAGETSLTALEQAAREQLLVSFWFFTHILQARNFHY